MKEIGDYAHTYFRELLIKKSSYWFRSVRIILGLANTYGNQRVNLTLKRALAFNVMDIPTIKRICEKQTYLLEIQPKMPKNPQQTTALARTPSYYNQIYLN